MISFVDGRSSAAPCNTPLGFAALANSVCSSFHSVSTSAGSPFAQFLADALSGSGSTRPTNATLFVLWVVVLIALTHVASPNCNGGSTGGGGGTITAWTCGTGCSGA